MNCAVSDGPEAPPDPAGDAVPYRPYVPEPTVSRGPQFARLAHCERPRVVNHHHRVFGDVDFVAGHRNNRGRRRRDSLDVSGELRLGRHLSAFAKLRNATDVGVDFEYYGPSTPPVARYQQHERFGALWTFGFKGTF